MVIHPDTVDILRPLIRRINILLCCVSRFSRIDNLLIPCLGLQGGPVRPLKYLRLGSA